MDGSDDYFTDDIFFDDQALAILDHEEQKYLTQITQNAPFRPITKRQRTDHGWKPGFGNRTISLDEIEDLPEISLQDDGSYSINGASRGNPPSDITAKVDPNYASSSAHIPAKTIPSGLRLNSALGRRAVPSTTSRTTPASRLQYAPSGKASTSWPNAPRTSTSPQLPLPSARSVIDKDPPHPLGKQIEELQQKLDQMSKENLKIQAALKAAEDVKLVKVGEVSVLRKTIEKTAQDHAVQISKLKSAKEEADAKQAEMQKTMQEEMARLKTQFTFKQHELEAARKPPQSVRPQRILREPPMTPIMFPELTPLRPVFMESKGLPQTHNPRKSPEQIKRPKILPGFQNAFATSTPLRPSQKRTNKGKQPDIEGFSTRVPPFPSTFQPPVSPRSPTRPSKHIEADVRMDDSISILGDVENMTVQPHIQDHDGDIEMAEDDDEGIFIEETEEETDNIEAFDWKAEMNRIILTHISAPSETLTFQTLLETAVTGNLPPETTKTYPAACARILEIVASTLKNEDLFKTLEHVCQPLVSMIPILSATQSFLPLAALFNLLTVLAYSIPRFGSILLSQLNDTDKGNSQVLVHMCEIIQEHLESSKQYAHKDTFSKEAILLLEALCFNVEDEHIKKLALIPRNRPVLAILLQTSQPSWLLLRVTRFLVLLASHRGLCPALLSIPGPDAAREEQAVSSTKPILLEHLSFHLTDTSRRKDPEYHDLKISILTFFALLSHSQPEVHTALVGSVTVIPSLVIYLSHLAKPIWEDNEYFITSPPDTIALAIHTLNQALFLLHHLIFSTTPFLNLRSKLGSVTQIRVFNGLTHIFIVTFGRLCYAEPPGWLDEKQRNDLILLIDVATEILDLVVDGPERDNIWQAYNVDNEVNSETDEEEMEAKLLGE